jgi:hypothetical protein
MPYDIHACRRAVGGGGQRLPAAKIIAWIERNFDFKTRKGGEEYRICNPFDSDTSFKFNINPDKGSCHCWTGDEWAGPINPDTGKRNCSFLKFVKLFRKCSYTEAVKDVLGASGDLKSYLRPENRHSTSEPVRKVAVALPVGTERLVGSDDPQARIVRNWLKSRGYQTEDIEKYDLHFLAMECFWPYYEFDTLVYWQSRNRFNKIYRFPDISIYDKEGKITGETEGSKGEFLYGFDECESASFVIVTESIFGQYTLGSQALASGGAILTATQIGKLRIIGPRRGIILSPDNDGAGIKSVFSNAKMLSVHGYPLYYSIPPRIEYIKDDKKAFTKDWNEFITELKLSRDEIRAIHDKRITKVTANNLKQLFELLPRKDKQKTRVDGKN